MHSATVNQLNAQQIEADIADTERKLEKATSIIEQYNREIKKLKKELEFLQQVRDRYFVPKAAKAKPVRSDRFARSTMAEAAEVALTEHGQPMHVNQLAGWLKEGGYPHVKNDKQIYTSLMACLTRDEAFIKVRPAVFDLRTRVAPQKAALPDEPGRAETNVGP